MNQPGIMRVLESLAEKLHQLHPNRQGERRPALDHIAQRLALDVFHGDEGLSLVLAHVIHGDDIGMVQTPGRTGLAKKTGSHLVAVYPE